MAEHNNNVVIRIKRQDSPNSHSYWEEFELAWKPGMNVTSSLMDIAANPVTREGKKTMPITYDSNCLEEVCGSCAMLINGRARMACSVTSSQPLPRWEPGRPGSTVSTRLSNSTPRCAQGLRSPVEGVGNPRSSRYSRKMLARLRGSGRTPGSTENDSPTAWPGVG